MAFSLVLLIAVIYLLYAQHNLKKTIADLISRISDLERGAPAVSAKPAKAKPEAAVLKESKTASAPWKKAKSDSEEEPDQSVAAVDLPPVTTEDAQPRAFVFTAEKTAALMAWMKENWFYAIAALSLALSGVFFVQYGIENGYLTPIWRVMSALGLGTALIGAGEWIRRRAGDDADSHTAYLPSVFSGAGLVALFAGVLAARQMYGLIGSEVAFAGLVAVSGLAVVLGWFYGPLLAAIGIVGAMTTPFLVSTNSGSELVYYYFAIVVVMGLLIDAIKRWAWVSVLALGLGFVAAWLVFGMGTGGPHFVGFALIAAIAAAAIPPLQFWPQHGGEMVSVSLARFKGRKPDWPEFPTRLATGAFAGATVATVLVSLDATSAAEVGLMLFSLAILLAMAVVWFVRAPALRDTIILPPLAFLLVLYAQSDAIGSLYLEFIAGRNRAPETSPPWTVTVVAGMALAGSALVFWRGLREETYRLVWAGGAALFAPLAVVLLDVWWVPVLVLGTGLWAWHAMAVAIVMTLFALQAARLDGDDRRRPAIFALSAMTMISFALMVMLSAAALTLAIAVMVVLAALIDRQLNLRLLSVFVQVGGVVVGYRLVADPGMFWAIDAPLWEFILAFVGVIALFGATWFLLKKRNRETAIVVMESAVWTLSGIFVTVELWRLFSDADNGHPVVGAFALIWLISAANQLYRLQIEGWMRWVRLALAACFGAVGVLAMLMILTFLNPLFLSYEEVVGPPVLDSLLVAYLLPGLVFGFVAFWFDHLHRWFRISLGVIAGLLAALYVGLEIRRFWQGDRLSAPGTTDGELYSYTVAMLLVSVAVLFFAFSKRSETIRRIAIVGIGLTIAKVFLIDMSGLTGLIRVASFLGLGLSLAGLAWVNRRMMLQWDEGEPEAAGDEPDTKADDAQEASADEAEAEEAVDAKEAGTAEDAPEVEDAPKTDEADTVEPEEEIAGEEDSDDAPEK